MEKRILSTLNIFIRPLFWFSFPISIPLLIWAAHISKKHDEAALKRAEDEWLNGNSSLARRARKRTV